MTRNVHIAMLFLIAMLALDTVADDESGVMTLVSLPATHDSHAEKCSREGSVLWEHSQSACEPSASWACPKALAL